MVKIRIKRNPSGWKSMFNHPSLDLILLIEVVLPDGLVDQVICPVLATKETPVVLSVELVIQR